MSTSDRVRSLGFAANSTERALVALQNAARSASEACVAEEVPVAFVYSGRPHVVMMCTPDNLEDLAVGFTVSEQIVEGPEHVEAIDIERHRRGIEVRVRIPQRALDALAVRARALAGRTGCGLCGVEAIDDAVRPARKVESALTFAADALWRAGASLDAHQPLNRETRTVHAAAWATSDGVLRIVREDVGRHNALDKVLGALLREGGNPATGFLVVTSRASFELVQKATTLGVPLLAAVSRPTGLAVTLAEESGLTLVGVLRGRSANIYTHAERVRSS